MNEKAIEISGLSFRYSIQEKKMLDNINFSIDKGEKIALMGESGKGKSTLLRLIASYEKKQEGNIKINSKEIDEKLVDDTVSYLPQDANKALFPWKTAEDNLYYPTKLRNGDLTLENKKFCDACINDFNLKKVLQNYPLNLSGGEKKRLSVIMALSIKPDIVLLDEPFAGLDFATTENLWKFLRNYFIENNTTVLLVTHSVDEAAVMADRVVFLDKEGKIESLESDNFKKYADQLTTEEGKSKLDNPGELLLLPQFNEYKKIIKKEYEKNCTKHIE
jgi:ABC-type nitrate/sulfonate/bicarbonate transport system ATPase subunit